MKDFKEEPDNYDDEDEEKERIMFNNEHRRRCRAKRILDTFGEAKDKPFSDDVFYSLHLS